MIFEELVLHNFGVYRGRHQIALAPKNPNKPVVLIGALNGSGKTTLLDALQLVLYGKFANCSNRGNLSYHDFLRRTINNNVDPADGAGLELQFRHTRGGRDETYRVTRVWGSTGKGMREDLEVYRAGVLDQALTERWYEYVDEFMPAPISSLFFFDGEKIEALAEATNSAALVRTGIHALLGLDLVDQLSKDLILVENRRRSKLQTQDEQLQLISVDSEIEELERRRARIILEKGAARNEVDRLEKEEGRLRTIYREAGGELYDRRDALESELSAVKDRLDDTDAKLRDLASGLAPLLLLPDLLASAQTQAQLEHETALYEELRNMLRARDSELVRVLKDLGSDARIVNTVVDHLQKDLAARDQRTVGESYLDTDPAEFAVTDGNSLPDLRHEIDRHLTHREKVVDLVVTLQQALAGIPADDAISEINASLEAVIAERRKAEFRLESLEQKLRELDAALDGKSRERQRHLEQVASKHVAQETTQRVLKHAQKSRRTLEVFRKAVAERHVARLEQSILESFRLLLRKKSLIARITIDPDSYVMALFDEKNKQVLPERLSAGERQLLAVAILWGLAKASGRPLPCIIDTPLGRLDSTHRKHLVEHYFPFASHQVILLSTDEEINGDYYRSLRRSIGRECVIAYDESKGASEMVAGYFH
jgi:DNA sulfur modification protein DndD